MLRGICLRNVPQRHLAWFRPQANRWCEGEENFAAGAKLFWFRERMPRSIISVYNHDMTEKSELGKWGEDRACEYLVDKGFRVVERNFRKPWGELDIITIAPDGTLVFVEVKTMSAGLRGMRPNKKPPELTRGFGGLEPEHQMTREKISKFKRTAQLYAGSKPKLVRDDKGWRLDLITLVASNIEPLVVSRAEPLTKTKKDCVIKHYENVF